MLLLNINGPINAGKTTVSRILARKLKNCLFIEVDDLLSDAEQENLKLDFRQGIECRLARLDEKLAEETRNNTYSIIVFAYPMSESNRARWLKHGPFKSVTLAPSLETCLQNRGARVLTDWEISRIKEMYEKGYARPAHADLILNNENQPPEETAGAIISALRLPAAS